MCHKFCVYFKLLNAKQSLDSYQTFERWKWWNQLWKIVLKITQTWHHSERRTNLNRFQKCENGNALRYRP